MAVLKWQTYRHPDLTLEQATLESDKLARSGLAGCDFRLAIDAAAERRPARSRRWRRRAWAPNFPTTSSPADAEPGLSAS